MADWWDNSKNRYESGSASSSSGLTNIGNFGWQNDIGDIKSRSSYNDSDQSVVTNSSGGIFQEDTQKLHGHDPNLHLMGLGLSSQALDWNHQALLREEKVERDFPSMLQENTNFQQDHAGMVPSQVQWREKLFPAGSSCSDSAVSHELKNINRGFSLDHQEQFVSSHESTSTCQGLPCASFQIDSSQTMFHGFLGSENQPQQQHSIDFPYQVANYSTGDQLLHPNLSRSVPQFLRNSPPKQQPHHGQFHFPSNAPQYWNSSAASMNDHIRPSFFSSLQTQFSAPNFEEKPKNLSDNIRGGAVNVMKKSGSETAASKRPRNEGPSPMPAFKVRKEKMGDRVTALQQLVSPFGKTDTASVLSEAIEYIKFLHEQVNVLSTPYLKSATPNSMQHQQISGQSKETEGPNQDLRSRGLCLVPISNTFPVTHETTVDFWTPTFGGTYR